MVCSVVQLVGVGVGGVRKGLGVLVDTWMGAKRIRSSTHLPHKHTARRRAAKQEHTIRRDRSAQHALRGSALVVGLVLMGRNGGGDGGMGHTQVKQRHAERGLS
jgi:hypothetical protein